MDIGHEVIFNNWEVQVMNRDVRLVVDRRGDLYYVHKNVRCARAATAMECSKLLKCTTDWVI